MRKFTLSLIVFAILVSLFGTQKSIQAQSPSSTQDATSILWVANLKDFSLPKDVLTRLSSKWAIRAGVNQETGWVADFSKANSFIALLNQKASSVGLKADRMTNKPESAQIVKNLVEFLTQELTSAKYKSQLILKAIGPTGAIIQMPKFTLENAPIVVVEYRDKKELGAIGKNKDVAYEATKFGSTLVRYYTPAKDNTPGYITIKLYEDVNMLSEHATLKALLGHASGTTWGVCFGYLGSDVMSGFMNFSLLQIMSVKLPDDTYATLADFNLVKK